MKENSEVFGRYVHEYINLSIDNSIFPTDLKVVDVTPVFKKKSKTSKDNYRPISIYLIYLKHMKDVLPTKFKLTLMKYYLNVKVHCAKDSMHSTA